MLDFSRVFNHRQLRRQLRLRLGLHRIKTLTPANIAMVLFIGFVAVILFIGLLFAWYAKDLPRPDKVSRTDGLSTVIVDRNGETLYDIYENQNRLPVQFANIPQYLKEATIAIEDKNFYQHQGLSSSGMLRAVFNTLTLKGLQGGSTLTQQLVKNVLLTQERSIPRKIKEAILSIQIERKYSKDDILLMYLNEAPYGGTAVGVESAAQYYFDKPVKDLNLVECAIIAGLPQSPSQYSPFIGQPDAYKWRTEQVLRRMREDGNITSTQETDAVKALDSIKFASGEESLRAPHFIAYIKEQLVEKFGSKTVEGGGLKVTTTLDWKIQDKAQSIVKQEVEKAKYLRVSNGAAVVMDPKTGEILAMVGSKDYTSTESGGFKFNVAVQGLRQPGSAIKPITYAAALKKGYTASTVLMDVDTKYPSGDPTKPEYNPKNYDNKFRGPVQLRYALANSINTIAVKVSALVGVRDILRTASEMGISSLAPTDENLKRIGLSLTLGGGEVTLLELTDAFGVFATGGLYHEPVSILKVEDPRGKILYEYRPTKSRQVLSQNVAFIISDMLSDNDARKDVFGLNSYLYIKGKTVAVKTGTTDDKRDNWTIGYSPSVVVGTWVGNNDNSPMHPSLASGVTGAAPIWNRLMYEVLKIKTNEPFIKPDSVIQMEIDSFGGGTAIDGSPKRSEYFIKGTEPTGMSPIYKQIKVSRKDSSKLANAIEIAKGEYDTKLFVVFSEQDPISSDGKNRWMDGINAWVAGQSDSKYHPPTETYQGSDEILIQIKEPRDMERINSKDVTVKVEVTTNSDSVTVELYVDNVKVKDRNDKSFSEMLSMVDGSHTIKAKAHDGNGKTTETEIRIGINTDYVSPTPIPTSTPTQTPVPTATNTPSPTP